MQLDAPDDISTCPGSGVGREVGMIYRHVEVLVAGEVEVPSAR